MNTMAIITARSSPRLHFLANVNLIVGTFTLFLEPRHKTNMGWVNNGLLVNFTCPCVFWSLGGWVRRVCIWFGTEPLPIQVISRCTRSVTSQGAHDIRGKRWQVWLSTEQWQRSIKSLEMLVIPSAVTNIPILLKSNVQSDRKQIYK